MANGAVKSAAKLTNKGNVPFWLLVLGLALMLFAFTRGEHASTDSAFDHITLDLLDPPGAGPSDAAPDGYSAARRSNHAHTLLRVGEHRFYALYGPAPGQLGGVLVGDADARDGGEVSSNLREFSVESGALRVAAQEGRFSPSRFIEGDGAEAGAPPQGTAGRYEGRLFDALGARPAQLAVAADGTLRIDSTTCHARGATAGAVTPAAAGAVQPVHATFEAGCAHHGETLEGHAYRRGAMLVVVLPNAALDAGAVFVGEPVTGHERGSGWP